MIILNTFKNHQVIACFSIKAKDLENVLCHVTIQMYLLVLPFA